MKCLLYVIKNIQKLIKYKPFLYTFLVVSQIVCVIVILLVCGLTDNASRSQETIEQEEYTFIVSFADYSQEEFTADDDQFHIKYDKMCTVKNIEPKFYELIEFLGDDFDCITFSGVVGDDASSLSFTSELRSDTYDYGTGDEAAVMENFEKSDKNILRLDPFMYKEVFGKSPEVGDTLDINGIQYTVAIIDGNAAALDMPYAALQDDFLLDTCWVITKDVCTAERNKEIERKISELFGNKEITAPLVRDLQDQQNINLIYMVTAAVIVMILLNISRVYTYILSYRKKSFAVMSICGASKIKIFAIYLVELMLTLAVTFGIGVLIFNTCILQPMGTMYPSFTEFMTPDVYRTVFNIYIAAALIIMSLTISIFISKTSVEMERG